MYNCRCANTIRFMLVTHHQLLVSWIGHADLLAMAEDMGDAGKALLDQAAVRGRNVERPGPLKTALSAGRFDEVHLLSNYKAVVHKPFAKWLGGDPVIHPARLTDPTDYAQVFGVVDPVLADLTGRSRRG